MKKLIKVPDLVDSVKESLFDAILTGKLRPGEKLSQEMLAEKLGVSRQPVSHAMRILSDQGILTGYDNKSLTVAEPDSDKMMQIIAVREQLDGLAGELAAQKVANKGLHKPDLAIIAELEKLLDRNRPKDKFDSKQAVRDDIRFHYLIRVLSGNPYIHESMAPYLLHHNRLIYIMASTRDPKRWPEHETILKAILKGDTAKARSSMVAHIKRGAEKLVPYFEKQAADKTA